MREDFTKADFPSEADLCDCLIETWNAEGWVCYPETAGFDILAVRADTGLQCGIEAKLKLNDKVVSQILPDDWAGCGTNDVGPNWRAILIPPGYGESGGVRALLALAGITFLRPEIQYHGHGWLPRCVRDDVDELTKRYDCRRRYRIQAFAKSYDYAWHDWNPLKQCTLPEYVPSVRAGVPGPIQLTPWKIAALKILAIIEIAGFVDRNGIKHCGVDPRRWCGGDSWLQPGDRPGQWVRGPNLPPFDKQHPIEFAQLVEKQRTRGPLSVDSPG